MTRSRLSILIAVLLFCFLGFNCFAAAKVPDYKSINKTNTKDCYFVISKQGKITKSKMTEAEKLMLLRLFSTNKYTDVYVENSFNKRIVNPYIELQLKSGRIIKLYLTSYGFVVLDNKKLNYVNQPSYEGYFSTCYEKYKSKASSVSTSDTNYKPELFKMNDFIYGIRKLGLECKLIKTQSDDIFKVPANVFDSADERINVYEYKDEIDMELDARRISSDGSSISSSGIFEWINPPHFFKRGNILVSYFGSNGKIIEALEKVVGKQFAGHTSI